jgi:hypothetical protein
MSGVGPRGSAIHRASQSRGGAAPPVEYCRIGWPAMDTTQTVTFFAALINSSDESISDRCRYTDIYAKTSAPVAANATSGIIGSCHDAETGCYTGR